MFSNSGSGDPHGSNMFSNSGSGDPRGSNMFSNSGSGDPRGCDLVESSFTSFRGHHRRGVVRISLVCVLVDTLKTVRAAFSPIVLERRRKSPKLDNSH